MKLGTPYIVVIIMFGILFIATLIINIFKDEIFIIRNEIVYGINYLVSRNSVGIDTATADCTVVDENEEIDNTIIDEFKDSIDNECKDSFEHDIRVACEV